MNLHYPERGLRENHRSWDIGIRCACEPGDWDSLTPSPSPSAAPGK